MEEEAHVRDNDVIDVSQQLIGRMEAELPRPERVETTDPAQQPRFFGEFLVDKGRDGPQGNQPGLLNVVHLLE